jgi:hypothetical protein
MSVSQKYGFSESFLVSPKMGEGVEFWHPRQPCFSLSHVEMASQQEAFRSRPEPKGKEQESPVSEEKGNCALALRIGHHLEFPSRRMRANMLAY